MDEWLFGPHGGRQDNSPGINWLPGMGWDEIDERWSMTPRQSYSQSSFRNSNMLAHQWGMDALRPVPASHFAGLAYAEAMRRARPIIAQWSEWERQTRMEGWR